MAKKKTSVSVNFKGVEGRGARLKPGEYVGEVEEVTQEKGDAGPYFKWVFSIESEGGAKAYFNTSLTKQSLWNLRGLLEAMGEEVPDDEFEIDFEEMVGKTVGLIIEMDEYKGVPKPKVVDYCPADDIEPSEGKDEEDDGKKKKKKKSKKDDDDKVKAEDVEEMDRDGLEELIKDKELDVDPDDHKKTKKLLAAVLEELKEKDLLEEEEEAEPEEKKGKKKKGKKAEKLDKMDKDEVEGLDQEELEDLIKKYSIDVDLGDYKTLKKMIAAVADAMEEGGYLND